MRVDLAAPIHRPCDYFAEVGFRRLSRRAGANGVAAWLRRAKIQAVPHRHGARLGGIRLGWVDRVPILKTWAGQMSLPGLLSGRQKALSRAADALAGLDLFAFAAPLAGASGFDPDAAADPIDVGFSPNVVGIPIVTRVGVELLAAVGLEFLPVVVCPDGRLGYRAGGRWWVFAVEDRAGGYLGRWGYARPASLADLFGRAAIRDAR